MGDRPFLLAALSVTKGQAQYDRRTPLPVTVGTYTAPMITGTVPQPDRLQRLQAAEHGPWYVYTLASHLDLAVTTDLPQNMDLDTRSRPGSTYYA